MESRMEESITNHSVAISRIKDCEDDMKICKEDIDQNKIHLSSVDRDIRMLEASMGRAHKQLEDFDDWMVGCHAEVRRAGSLSESHSQSLGFEIKKVQQEAWKEIEGLFSKFEKVNQIFDKKTVHMEEELERVVSLVDGKINVKIGEITANWVEALEIEENRRRRSPIAFFTRRIR